jgi:hypothetical protein
MLKEFLPDHRRMPLEAAAIPDGERWTATRSVLASTVVAGLSTLVAAA